MKTKTTLKDKLIDISKKLYSADKDNFSELESMYKQIYKEYLGEDHNYYAPILIKDDTLVYTRKSLGKHDVNDYMVADIRTGSIQKSDLGTMYRWMLIFTSDGCDLYHNETKDQKVKYLTEDNDILFIYDHLFNEFSDIYDRLTRSENLKDPLTADDFTTDPKKLMIKGFTGLMKNIMRYDETKKEFIERAMTVYIRSITDNQEIFRLIPTELMRIEDLPKIIKDEDALLKTLAKYCEDKKDASKKKVSMFGSDYEKELLASLNHVIKAGQIFNIDMTYLAVADIIQRRDLGTMDKDKEKALDDYLKAVKTNTQFYDDPIELFKITAKNMLKDHGVEYSC